MPPGMDFCDFGTGVEGTGKKTQKTNSRAKGIRAELNGYVQAVKRATILTHCNHARSY